MILVLLQLDWSIVIVPALDVNLTLVHLKSLAYLKLESNQK